MSDEVLVDTNVLVYAQDADEHDKQLVAIEILDRLQAARRIRVTPQVLGEYFVAVRRRFADVMSDADAAAQIERFGAAFDVLDTGLRVVLEAARGVLRHGFSFYDAQIWAAAKVSGTRIVLSEDFSPGREVEGVLFVDPFGPTAETALGLDAS